MEQNKADQLDSWDEWEDDIRSLVRQTCRGTTDIAPGLSRLQVEFHLVPTASLSSETPTPHVLKLIVVLMIFDLAKEHQLEAPDDMTNILAYLLQKLDMSALQQLDNKTLGKLCEYSIHLDQILRDKLQALCP